MTGRHQRAKDLFLRCCELDRAAQKALLDDECAGDPGLRSDVEAMLSFDDGQTDFLERSPELPATPPTAAPTSIAGFRVLGILGEGGMGTVYEAEQDRPARQVALKVMRPGLASETMLRRFDHEVLALGRLQHPGIASIFEAGTFDDGAGPQPYFALELIRGETLIQHADKEGLETRDRLELIARVCEAIHHAHSHGIIHRDLKPANILVDGAGQPKILDFGVARTLDAEVQTATLATDVGQLIGTLPYMSPEQVEADPDRIDARVDVYALGVLLFEILTGRLPHDVRGKLIHEAAEVILESDHTRLSSVDRVFRGDLDTIVATALEKDRDRRYSSARALADDIDRYLRDQPIVARPATSIYHLRKFARRNKALVFGIIAVIVSLSAGLVGTMSQASRATARQHEAEAEAARVRSVLDFFLSGMLSSVNPWEDGKDVLMVSVLDEVSRQSEVVFEDDPDLEAEIRGSLGAIYKNLGLLEPSENHLRRAHELRTVLHGANHPQALDAASSLGAVLHDRGDLDASLTLLDDTLLRCREHLGDTDPITLACISRTAVLYHELERHDQAEGLLDEALSVRRASLGENHEDTLHSMASLTHVYLSQERYDDAAELAHTVHAGRSQTLGPDHPATIRSLQAKAKALIDLGQFDAAETTYREVVDLFREILGDDHLNTLDAINDLGGAVHWTRGPEEAEPIYREAVTRARNALGNRHPALAVYCNNLATALEETSRYDDAREFYEESLTIRETHYGRDSLRAAVVLNNLGTLHHRNGQAEKAEAYYRESISVYERLFGDKHSRLADSRANLGALLFHGRRFEEAETWLRASVVSARATLPSDHPKLPAYGFQHAVCLVALERYEEAEPLMLSCLEGYRAAYDEGSWDIGNVLVEVVRMYTAWGRPEDAGRFQDELDAIREALRAAEGG